MLEGTAMNPPASPVSPATPGCTLTLEDAVVLVSRGGAPEAECALFEAAEIELEAERPGTNREKGYRTTAGQALQRLADMGVTPELAAQAADRVRPALARTYARGAAARCIVERLDPDELFESRTYDAAAARYEGTWLDLAGLSRDLGPANAGALLQGLHLAATLAAVPADAPVLLSTGDTARRPGARTLRRVDLSGARAVVDALREIRPSRTREAIDAGPTRAEAIAWIHARARRSPSPQRRFAAMEAALSAREAPARGPLSETALWNLEAKLTRGEVAGVLEQLDELEKRRGRAPGTTYLRARLSLMNKTEEPRVIAERASALSTSMAGFHELELLAAQAWLSAGDMRRARAFARDLHDNASADDVLRTQALAILESAGPGSSATHVAVEPEPPQAPRRPPTLDAMTIPRAPRAPSASALEAAGASSQAPIRAGSSASMRSLPPGTSFPPYRVEPRGERTLVAQAISSAEPERLETLALPPGVQAEAPPSNDPPRNPAAARLSCTYLARELGRELRLRHAVEIRDDLDGLETAQRYLRETFVDGRVRTPEEEREIMRHGGFLSELLARRLGGAWVEVQSSDAGTWAMLIPSRGRPGEVLRVWPFGRVLRFVVMGHRERDLVSYVLDLEARSR
jgi:hypothetical protein